MHYPVLPCRHEVRVCAQVLEPVAYVVRFYGFKYALRFFELNGDTLSSCAV